jgi:hypothetical protein
MHPTVVSRPVVVAVIVVLALLAACATRGLTGLRAAQA